jgi:FkbH-like protein
MQVVEQVQEKESFTDTLKSMLRKREESFWPEMVRLSGEAATFDQLVTLSSFRKKGLRLGLNGETSVQPETAKIAIIGGSTLFPLSELVEHKAAVAFGASEVMVGDFNNYRSEILSESSAVYDFAPDFIVILPDEQSCRYLGDLTDPREIIEAEIDRVSRDLLELCAAARERSGAQIILCNFIPPPTYDLGPLRSKSLGSEWSFKKAVNLRLALETPNYVQICDLEFLAYRIGGLAAKDDRHWFESKQSCSPELQVALAHEVVHLVRLLRSTPKKVLVLDLDNTLWGGVIGDDGIEGIELGGVSPRGEAFQAFQSYIHSLIQRGMLLAVCSKNDFEIAMEPFRRHPEMILKEHHFVSFKSNWEPKGKNLIEMSEELNLGLDSFIFVDDNPAEIENVRQFAPDVTAIHLGPDPSFYTRQLQESRLFERLAVTREDTVRTEQYRVESVRRRALSSSANMDEYLRSLEMVGKFSSFNSIDLPRIAQLVNKSNQFNLTTKRRTESELESLMSDPDYICFSLRLEDRFGDHGLISVLICSIGPEAAALEIDTWLMSCRVLKRQVEEFVLNEIVRIARSYGLQHVLGTFRPTSKNSMVRDLYPRLGFDTISDSEETTKYKLSVDSFSPFNTRISLRPVA